MATNKSFDKTVRKLCNKKITDPSQAILGEVFTVEQAIADAVIKKAMSGSTDCVKLIREILGNQSNGNGEIKVDINVVE